MVVAVVLSVPLAARAAEGDVAQIGETTYKTLGAAIDAANEAEGDVVITLLQSCDLDKRIAINQNKRVTITAEDGPEGNLKIADSSRMGITLSTSSALTVENVDIDTNGQIYLNGKGGSLTFKNMSLAMDGEMYAFNGSGYYCCAIAIEQPESSVTFDASTVEIKDYPSSGSAIRWNGSGTDSGYSINIINDSTLTSTNCYSGFVGTCDIVIDDSVVNVAEHRGNGSNGSYFDIRNKSEVTFTGNGSHGISAGGLKITGSSTVISDNNELYGIYVSNALTVDGTSTVKATRNSDGGDYAGLKITKDVTDGKVEKGAVVTITDNYCSGLSNNGKVVFEEGVNLTITGNKNDKGNSSHGGGVYNSGASADLTLPSDATIYDNHALTDGDDIYNSAGSKIAFGKVGDGWKLDGSGIGGAADDCTEAIDGWYDDSESTRWEAHNAPYHAVEFNEFTNGIVSTNEALALKAAHGLTPLDPSDPELPDWGEHSKSKTATNLDVNYDSEVTLGLPAKDVPLETDVVFVLDKSTSTIGTITEDALEMLGQLNEQVGEDAQVKVGIVRFGKEAYSTGEWYDLDTQQDSIKDQMNQGGESGTNLHAGIEYAKKMLDEDRDVDASRKYLIVLSDGLTYIYNDENGKPTSLITVGYEMNASTIDPSPVYTMDAWDNKYGYEVSLTDAMKNDDPVAATSAYLEQVGKQVEADAGKYDVAYDRLESSKNDLMNFIRDNYYTPLKSNNRTAPLSDDDYAQQAGDEVSSHANNIDTALYKSAKAYKEAQEADYHCYAMYVEKSADNAKLYPWGKEFMTYLAGGESVDFSKIQNDIYYLLDAGSSVVDYIGSGTDDKKCEYDFSFVDDLNRLTLTVGDKEQEKVELVDASFTNGVTSAYGFGAEHEDHSYDYELYYYANGTEADPGEHFVWKINVPVSNFAPVELTYAVHLENPTADGEEHGVYSGDGSVETAKALYTNNEATLYPVDSNEEQGVPENFPKPTVSYQTATIQPADITIYMNGEEGYQGVVNGSGEAIKGDSEHLPEPGFYITLPKTVNDLLVEKELAAPGQPANLSDYLTISAGAIDNEGAARSWTLVPYGESPDTSSASGGYIYRIVSGEGQDPVRLQFTDKDGATQISDTFIPSDALYNNYTMSIYSGGVDMSTVMINLVSEDHDLDIHVPLYTESGTLTIRYVTTTDQIQVVTDVIENSSDTDLDTVLGTAREQNPDKALAVLDDGAKYWVNGSSVDVSPDGENYEANPSLLFDDIVTDQAGDEEDEYDTQLLAKATAEIAEQGHQLEVDGHESKYLDLVDAVNGNTWLTTDSPVTIYWPYPDEAGADAEYHLVHFQGLDRDMASDEVVSQIEDTEPKYIDVEKDEHGIMFTLDPDTETGRVSFSPFVLVWGSSSGSTDPEPPDPDYFGDLKVSKTVTGNLSDPNDEFTFRVTVEGAGDQTYGGVEFTDDVATITLKGGETVTIKNLPKGAKYTVEEIDGLDYELASSKNTSGTIPFSSVTASFVNDKSEPESLDPTDPVNPGGSKVLLDADGNPVALAGGEFTFKLTGLDGAPMPAGAVDGSITVTNRADGTFVFGDIVFDEAGTYTYELTEVAGTAEGVTYDGSTHTLVVVVSDKDADGDGRLDIESLTYDGGTTLPTFTNTTASEEPPAPDPDQPGTDEPAEPTTPGVPDTGDHTVSALPAVLALGGVALVGGALAVARRRVR